MTESLEKLDDDERDEPLALTQLILLYHLVQERQRLTEAASETNG